MPGFRSTSMNASPAWLADDDGNPIGTVANPLVTSGGGGGGGGVVTQPTASNLNAQVVGNVAAGTTDAGNPLKVGAIYNTTLPTYTVGQRADAQSDANGNLRVYTTYSIITGSDGQSNNSLGRPGGATVANSQILPISAGYYFNGTTWDRQRGDTNGAYLVSKGSGTLATAQVSVGTASTQIVAARAGRGAVTITNLGTTDVYVGVTGVTSTTGTLLVGSKGASITIPTNAAVFGVAATAQSVAVLEVF